MDPNGIVEGYDPPEVMGLDGIDSAATYGVEWVWDQFNVVYVNAVAIADTVAIVFA